MTGEQAVGYTQEEYYAISSKERLPKRCPILRICCKAVWTRYVLGFDAVGAKITFEDFLSTEGQYWEPDKMIKTVEQMRWVEPDRCGKPDVFYALNICPEVTLFEKSYLPSEIVASACGDVHFYYESKRAEVTPKHYSECAEFSEYCLKNYGLKNTKMSSRQQHIPESILEDHLVQNLDVLEPGLKFIERQKAIGKWKADIFARDAAGIDVVVELKSKILNSVEIDNLVGQVSRYYHRLKSKDRDLRIFIVLPLDNRDLINNLYHGLKPWIDNKKVTIFEFDYNLYGKSFIFSKIDFDKFS